jgi:hypothetical protein
MEPIRQRPIIRSHDPDRSMVSLSTNDAIVPAKVAGDVRPAGRPCRR